MSEILDSISFLEKVKSGTVNISANQGDRHATHIHAKEGFVRVNAGRVALTGEGKEHLLAMKGEK